MKIKTDYWPKPIPLRCFDWTAVDDDTYDGPSSPCGCGRTEQDAIDDLLSQLEDQREEQELKRLQEINAFLSQDEMTDEEYARAEEDAQRKRDAKEGW